MGLASLALGVGAAYEAHKQRQQKQEDEARSFDTKLRAAAIEYALKNRQIEPAVTPAGQVTGFQRGPGLTPFDPSTLRPGERATVPIPSGGTRTYTGPQETKVSDAVKAALLAKHIQEIEQKNALAPVLAAAELQKNTPPPTFGFGGFVNTEPDFWQRLAGTQQRPQAPQVPQIDVAPLKDALNSYLGQLGSSAAPAGVAAQPSSVPVAEVNDLLLGIQRGQIQSRSQAIALIQQAGYDPNDPAFQGVLSRLR